MADPAVSMTPAEELRRLRWRCRRGMRELDALLMRYVDAQYATAAADDQAAFRAVLQLPDPEILALLTGRAASEDAAIRRSVELILAERVSRADRNPAEPPAGGRHDARGAP